MPPAFSSSKGCCQGRVGIAFLNRKRLFDMVRMLVGVRVWVLLSALLVGSGWILSASRQLNRAGYGMILALTGMAVMYWWRKTKPPMCKVPARLCRPFQRRFRRPAPLLFLALVLTSLLARSLYLHSNGDSNAYRIPRVLHWLGREQWHWIYTLDPRMECRGVCF